MYTAFYGLREKPFSLTPDPRFLFLSTSHREALAHVLYGVDQGEGFIAITGEVGTGKTTLCRTLLQRLGSDTEVAFLFNPTLSGEELLRSLSVEFGLPTEGRGRAELNDQLNRFLLDANRAGRRVLLIIDEAQNLSRDTLEEIRLFSNLETPTAKLLQILLFGQPELDEKLESRELRQLRQRISVRWRLEPLTAAETRDYVRHRCRVAAGYEADLFNLRALREVHRRAKGTPRLVNLICDRALLAGYAAGQREIGPDTVRRAARDVFGPGTRRRFRGLFRGAAALGLAAGIGLGLTQVGGAPAAVPSPGVTSPVSAGPAPNHPAARSSVSMNSQVARATAPAELEDGAVAPTTPNAAPYGRP